VSELAEFYVLLAAFLLVRALARVPAIRRALRERREAQRIASNDLALARWEREALARLEERYARIERKLSSS